MNIADEGTGAHLKAQVYSTCYMGEINPNEAIRDVNNSFTRWGMPISIKIDNGWPFVNPAKIELPSLAILWWVGLGIKVIQNRPRSPQCNGTVENLQGTLASWSNPKGQNSILDLQTRLESESDFQRNDFPVMAKGGKTRKELYPELEANPRVYSPDLFEINRVYEYLSQGVWQRKVDSSGFTRFNGNKIYIGKAYVSKTINITFDPQELLWNFAKLSGERIKTSEKGVPTKDDFKSLASQ